METHQISLIGGGDDEVAIFTEDQFEATCVLTCEYRGKQIKAMESDFFEALCVIRKEMSKENLIPFCYGASLNVFPSRMSRDMAAGKAAYKMEMGMPATKEQIVGIFEQGPDIMPATVELQKEYFNEWLLSLKRVLR